MGIIEHDVRYALRLLVRQPVTTAMVLLTLALGIGANTAVFSVVHAVLLRPLPYTDPGRLVMIFESRLAEGVTDNFVSPADLLDWARLQNSFDGIAGFSSASGDLTGAGDPVQLPIAAVSPAFFDVLGVGVLHGRTFAAGEDVVGRDRIAIIDHSLWRQRFGGDPSVIGRTIELNGRPLQIIGVLPANFEFPGETPQIWVPLTLQDGVQPPPRAAHFLLVYARLKSHATLESARADMTRIGDQLSAQYSENRYHNAHVMPLTERIVAPARNGLLVVMSAVAFLLLIACTNVANLLLARSAGRRRELAIRSAVGAARTRLLRQSLTESLVVSGLGALAGLLVASWVLQLIVSETPPALGGVGLDRARLDGPVLLFTALVCVVTAIIAGALPAWQVSRTQPGDPLREGGRSPVSLKRSVRTGLIASEVALTVLLLIGAGLMVRTFMRVASAPSGIETDNRLTVNLTLPRVRYPNPDAIRQARRALDERFSTIPGVLSVGVNNQLPLTGADSRLGITVDGFERREGDSPVRAHTRIVTPSYFSTLGIRVRDGRTFAVTDDARAPMVVVVNDTMARRYWPGQSAVGQRMRFNAPGERWREVIGVIHDVKHWGLDREVNPEVYMPHEQQPSTTLGYVLHTSGDPLSLIPAIATHVRAVDPSLPLGAARTFDEVAARSMAARRWSALLLGAFAVLGLVLAAAGIYGVMTHLVSLRRGEIGIRLTLGASPVAVLREVLGEALLNTGIGLAIGVAAAVLATRALQSLLFEIQPLDPVTFVGTAVVTAAMATLAALAPAIRAMRVDPVQTLRSS